MIFKLCSIIIISCLGFLIYSNTFAVSFHLDDVPSIVDNFLIRNINHLSSVWNFLPRRFMLYLSLALNYRFNGLEVFGYHVFNLGVHLISAILVWWLMILTLSTPALKDDKITRHANSIALFAGLIFVAHPIQTQAVSYIVQRAASMAAMFYLASLCLYVKARLQETLLGFNVYYWGALLTAVIAMFTKETAITLPLMIILYEYTFFRIKEKVKLTYLIPFLITLFIIPVTMALTEAGPGRIQQLRSEPGISSIHYLLTQFRVMITYIRLVFLPFNQNLDYDYPISKSIFEVPTIMSLSFLILILWGAKRLFLRYRLVSFAIFWFFLTLIPESSILPIKDVIFEHRLYLPMVGGSLFLVSIFYYFFENHNYKLVVAILLVIVSFYSFQAYQRNKVWKNEITLWQDTVEKSPHKARPYNNLGVAYAQEGKLDQAWDNFNKALKMDPQYMEVNYNIGFFYEKRGDFTKAIPCFTKVIDVNPRFAKAYYQRAFSYDKQGNITQAMADFTKAINVNQYDANSYSERGLIYMKQGLFRKAFYDFSKAVEINPEAVVALNNLGVIYDSQGVLNQAILCLNRALKINTRYAQAYCNRAITGKMFVKHKV